MNNAKQTFTITIPSKTGYMDLTEDVMECVRRSNIRNGIITVSSMHTTSRLCVHRDKRPRGTEWIPQIL